MCTKELIAALSMTLAATACTRASSEKAKKQEAQAETKAPAAARARGPVAEVAPIAERADLTKFAASADDIVAVMIRFDRLRKTALGAATEKLLSFMPDHQRVVGTSGTKTLDLFDLVLITSSSPSQVTATNMAAAMRVPEAKLRAILDNDLSKVTWSRALGGAKGTLSQTTRFAYEDPRVYLTPLSRWIVLSDPKTLVHLTDTAPGDLEGKPKKEQLVPWLTRLPALFELGDSKLIALATLTKLPESVQVPLVGKLAMARRASIALLRHRDRDVFSGTLSFQTARDAELFAGAIAAARLLLPGSAVPEQFHKTVTAALQHLVVQQRGTELRWSAPMSRKVSADLTRMAAHQLKVWTQGWTFQAPPKPDPLLQLKPRVKSPKPAR